MTASTKPSTVLPESPMKILAGGKLNNRKPTQLPRKLNSNTLTQGSIGDDVNKMNARVMMLATPAARPSAPSSMFKAFMKQTMNRIVRSKFNHAGPMGTDQPASQIGTAAAA